MLTARSEVRISTNLIDCSRESAFQQVELTRSAAQQVKLDMRELRVVQMTKSKAT